MKKRRPKNKKNSFFNNPFAEQVDWKFLEEQKQKKAEEELRKSSRRRIDEKVEEETKEEELTDEEFFRFAMRGVEPLSKKNCREPEISFSPAYYPNEEELALKKLNNLVSGKSYFDIYYSDEYVEGYVHDLDLRMLGRLRNGEYAWQRYLDLHGLRVEEAKEMLQNFIQENYLQGRRCVLIIHGRGHHSVDKEPVLKQKVVQWLSEGQFLSKKVLAFTSARPFDGGLGALYVLLRKPKKR